MTKHGINIIFILALTLFSVIHLEKILWISFKWSICIDYNSLQCEV